MILRRGIFTLVLQVCQIAATAGIIIVVTRVTGAEGRGIYSLMGTLASMATAISAVGVSWAGIYYIGKREFPLEDVVATQLTAALVSAAVGVLGIAAAYLLARDSYFKDVTATQLVITLALAVLMQLSNVASAVVLGLNRPIEFTTVNVLQTVTALILMLILALVGALTATTALAGWAVGAAAGALLAFAMVRREVRIRLGIDRVVLRAFLRYGAKGYLANIFMSLNYRLDSLILNGLIGVVAVGYYSISTALAEVLWYFANAFGLIVFPHVSSLPRKEAHRVVPIICRNTFLVTLVGVLFMFAAGRWIILILFGPRMLPALYPLWLLLPGIATASIAKVLSSYLSGIGKAIYATYIGGGSLVVTVTLDVLLIPRYGIPGAAIASTVAYTAATVASIWAFRRESGVGLLETLVVQPADFARYRSALGVTLRRLNSLRPAPP